MEVNKLLLGGIQVAMEFASLSFAINKDTALYIHGSA
jgi:hypothetical protein